MPVQGREFLAKPMKASWSRFVHTCLWTQTDRHHPEHLSNIQGFFFCFLFMFGWVFLVGWVFCVCFGLVFFLFVFLFPSVQLHLHQELNCS